MKDGKTGVQKRFRSFLAEHPGGWGHDDWVNLLQELSDAGVDITQQDEIGLTLERERVKAFLEGTGVKGLGPKRRDALASRFGRLWDLEQATVEELAEIPTIPRSLAEAVHRAVN